MKTPISLEDHAAMRLDAKSGDASMPCTCYEYAALIVWQKAEIERLRDDLTINKRLLARQCDLAREAESQLEECLNGFLRGAE